MHHVKLGGHFTACDQAESVLNIHQLQQLDSNHTFGGAWVIISCVQQTRVTYGNTATLCVTLTDQNSATHCPVNTINANIHYYPRSTSYNIAGSVVIVSPNAAYIEKGANSSYTMDILYQHIQILPLVGLYIEYLDYTSYKNIDNNAYDAQQVNIPNLN